MGAEGNGEMGGRRYFLLQLLNLARHLPIRVLVILNAELNKAEQVVWGQHLSLGYGAGLSLNAVLTRLSSSALPLPHPLILLDFPYGREG